MAANPFHGFCVLWIYLLMNRAIIAENQWKMDTRLLAKLMIYFFFKRMNVPHCMKVGDCGRMWLKVEGVEELCL